MQRPKVNPLRIDPTRTKLLVARWERDILRRVGRLQRELKQLVEEEDAFGLRTRATVNAQWEGVADSLKLELFKIWLKERLTAILLSTDSTLHDPLAPWFETYIEEAYRRGISRAFDDVKKYPALGESLDFYAGTRGEFLRSAFGAPVSVERVKLLSARTFTNLQAITEDMSNRISSELVDGMIKGLSPREVARNIANNVDGITKKRALVIARTETIKAHAEGQLDAFERLGVEEIGAAVEWSDANDFKVCPLCKALDGIVLKTKEAHGKIPLHPNCRCAWIPANVGESKAGQKRTRERIGQAIRASLKGKRKKEGEAWLGKIDEKRPKSILD